MQHISGIMAGVSINPATPVWMLSEIIGDVDMALIMSVNPGFGGQRFIPTMIDKLRRLRGMIDRSGFPVKIEIDGGVSLDNLAEVVRAGCDWLVIGSAIFHSGDPASTVSRMPAALSRNSSSSTELTGPFPHALLPCRHPVTSSFLGMQ